MKLFGVMANDKVNRYNEIVTMEALISAYLEQWQETLPLTINHDRTRLIGASKMSGIFMEPGATLLTNQSIIPENNKEKVELEEFVSKGIFDNLYQKNKNDYEKLLELLNEYLSTNYELIYADSIAIVDEGIVCKLLPELWDDLDKDGLIELSKLNPVLPGVFQYDNYLVYAHSYFRRSLSRKNTLNVPFLKRIQELIPNAKIALDPHMIGLAGTQSDMREYAYWWGPKFDDDLGKIPLGVTHFENEKYDALMSPIVRTECGWYIQDDIKTFECEELTDIKNITDSKDLYGCRYVHSMLSQSNIPYHLDGAIRAYDDEKMINRLEQNMNDSARNTTYTKLWRVDGEIPIYVWKELITHFYRDNFLVGEYFCGQKYSDFLEDSSNHQNDLPQKNDEEADVDEFISTNMNEGSGIRVQFTIGKCEPINSTYDIVIRPIDYFINKTLIKSIEYESITLIKFLKKNNHNVYLPHCNYLTFNDLIINFPIFICDSVTQGNAIFASIMEFCRIWANNKDDRIISFSIKVNYLTSAITYSMLGHINDFIKVFVADGDCEFPKSEDEIVSWCELIRKKIDIFTMANQIPSASRLNNSDGVLTYRRIYIDDTVIMRTHTDDGGMFVELCVTENTAKKLIDNSVVATSVHMVNSSICNRCGKQYELCGCIKFLEANCTNSFLDAKYIGAFWTTRQA